MVTHLKIIINWYESDNLFSDWLNMVNKFCSRYVKLGESTIVLVKQGVEKRYTYTIQFTETSKNPQYSIVRLVIDKSKLMKKIRKLNQFPVMRFNL